MSVAVFDMVLRFRCCWVAVFISSFKNLVTCCMVTETIRFKYSVGYYLFFESYSKTKIMP